MVASLHSCLTNRLKSGMRCHFHTLLAGVHSSSQMDSRTHNYRDSNS